MKWKIRSTVDELKNKEDRGGRGKWILHLNRLMKVESIKKLTFRQTLGRGEKYGALVLLEEDCGR